MGDAAGQLPDRFHFLGLVKLLFEFVVLGNVIGDAGNPTDPAFVITDEKGPIVDPPNRAIGANDAILHIVLRLLLILGRTSHPLVIAGMRRVQPGTVRLVEAFATTTPNFFIGRADVDDFVRGSILEPKDAIDVFDDTAKTMPLAGASSARWCPVMSRPMARTLPTAAVITLRDEPHVDNAFACGKRQLDQDFLRLTGREDAGDDLAVNQKNPRSIELEAGRKFFAHHLADEIFRRDARELLDGAVDIEIAPLAVQKQGDDIGEIFCQREQLAQASRSSCSVRRRSARSRASRNARRTADPRRPSRSLST